MAKLNCHFNTWRDGDLGFCLTEPPIWTSIVVNNIDQVFGSTNVVFNGNDFWSFGSAS